ncbi:hypothetical protein GY45DRAFT_1437746 [Cubamyces sp. BRFM 1775]|nr:hypothetical protein GY45DRAFT_1437746 [Cubamyces sp. BRFM 1775]
MPLLGETVEASREKRLERQQARFRDRGGIFKPSGHNALLDILLARGVNGESPSRANSPRRSRSRSASPARKHTTVESSTQASHSAYKKRSSRKSVGRKVVQEDIHGGAYTEPTPHEEEGIAGPSNHTTRTKAGKERRTKANTKKARSQASTTQTHAESLEEDAATAGPSKRQAKGNKAKKPTATNSQSKRNTKRNASAPEPDEEPMPSAHDSSGDEPLRPQKKTSKKPPARDKHKAKADIPSGQLSIAEDKEPRGDVGVPEPPKARRRGAKKADTIHTSTAEAEEKTTTSRSKSDPTTKQTRQQQKGKRKAKAVIINEDEDEPYDSRSTKKPRAKEKDAPQAQDHADDDVPQATSKARQHLTDHAVNTPTVTSIQAHSKTKSKITQPMNLAPVEDEAGEEMLPSPDIPAMPSSPDLPLVKTLMSAPKPETTKARSPKRKEDIDDTEHDVPPPPRKKRRPPEDMAAVAVVERKDPSFLINNTARKVSRTKAPPILAPKGTVLKPKPRPRLSLFPAPTLEEDSEDDPINFLS